MKKPMERACMVGGPLLAMAALWVAAGLMSSGCDQVDEAIDDFDSAATCADYCDKKYTCNEYDATDDETDACVTDCRSAIENNCGNENQASATEKIEECIDKGCIDFWDCLVFDAAPECFGFVSQ